MLLKVFYTSFTLFSNFLLSFLFFLIRFKAVFPEIVCEHVLEASFQVDSLSRVDFPYFLSSQINNLYKKYKSRLIRAQIVDYFNCFLLVMNCLINN